jgi:hypothetical protein
LPIDDYLDDDDGAFSWEVVKGDGKAGTTVIKLTSQSWRAPDEVSRQQWEHWLMIARPETLKTDKCFLLVSGGGNDGTNVPDGPSGLVKTIAEVTGSIVVELKQIPNQPIVFHGDGTPRKEDDLIAYCWDQFLDTGDATWLPRLPMVKSVCKAMDCIEKWSKEEGIPVQGFVVAGASKRGWTTWMTGATDDRVEAIVPIVIDVLNLDEQLLHHGATYGFWAKALGDYVRHGIVQNPEHPRMEELHAIEDPYSYLDRLTLPKYIVNGSGDQFFVPDSSRFYYDDLRGEKHLRYVPNTDHGVEKNPDSVTSIIAFYEMIIAAKARPEPAWTFEKDGSIRVRSNVVETTLEERHQRLPSIALPPLGPGEIRPKLPLQDTVIMLHLLLFAEMKAVFGRLATPLLDHARRRRTPLERALARVTATTLEEKLEAVTATKATDRPSDASHGFPIGVLTDRSRGYTDKVVMPAFTGLDRSGIRHAASSAGGIRCGATE